MRSTTFTFLYFLYFSSSHALHNVTVDNASSSFIFQGPWGIAQFPGYDIGGSQELIDLGNASPGASSATASLTFTGTAVYYWSPLWPYEVNTLITLDDESPAVVTMVDTSHTTPIGAVGPSVISGIRWSRTGLSNTQHTITFSLVPQGRYIVVDAITYTALDTSDIPVPQPPPPASTTRPTTDSSASSLDSSISTSTLSGSSVSTARMIGGASGSSSTGRPGQINSPTATSPNDPNNPNSSSSSSPSGNMVNSNSGSSHGRSVVRFAVIGSVCTLFAVGVIVGLVYLLCRRRRRRRREGNALSPFLLDPTVPPLSISKTAESISQEQRTTSPSSPMATFSSTHSHNEKTALAETHSYHPSPSHAAESTSSFPISSSSSTDPMIFAQSPLRGSILSYNGSIAPPPYQPRLQEP